jgi:hypothetical protein
MAQSIEELNKLAQIAEMFKTLKVNAVNKTVTLFLDRKDYDNMLNEVVKMTKVKGDNANQTSFSMYINDIEFKFLLLP